MGILFSGKNVRFGEIGGPLIAWNNFFGWEQKVWSIGWGEGC